MELDVLPVHQLMRNDWEILTNIHHISPRWFQITNNMLLWCVPRNQKQLSILSKHLKQTVRNFDPSQNHWCSDVNKWKVWQPSRPASTGPPCCTCKHIPKSSGTKCTLRSPQHGPRSPSGHPWVCWKIWKIYINHLNDAGQLNPLKSYWTSFWNDNTSTPFTHIFCSTKLR